MKVRINALLRKMRQAQGIQQSDIARKSGLSKQMVSKIEHAYGNPTLETLIKYCNCIHIDLETALFNYYKTHLQKEH